MIQFTLEALQAMGFQKNQVYTTLELRMKCGIGKCGRCNIGDRYVCKDGPVFRCDQLDRAARRVLTEVLRWKKWFMFTFLESSIKSQRP